MRLFPPLMTTKPPKQLREQRPKGDTMKRAFMAFIQKDPKSNLYYGIVPGIPGAHTQAESLEELKENLKEVLVLCLKEYEVPIDELPKFIGIHQIEVNL